MAEYASSHLLIALTEEEYKISEQGKSTMLEIYDRFNVDIPYSNSYIRARVMLNALDPLQPPDLIILYPSLEIDLDYFSLFKDWNPSDRKAFLIVFERVKQAFRKFYLEIFGILASPDMQVVLNSCGNFADSRQIEVLLAYQEDGINEAVFTLPVPVTLAHESCTRPVQCNVTLLKNYERFAVDIVYPNWATHLHEFSINKISNVNTWPINKFSHVMRQIYDYLKKEINTMFNSKDQRAIFFTELVKAEIGVPLEIDTVEFLKMSFHMEYLLAGVFEILNCVVILEKDFPKTSPIYKLRSMKSIKNNELREKKYPKVKGWDMDNEIKVLAEIFKSTIVEELPSFITWVNK